MDFLSCTKFYLMCLFLLLPTWQLLIWQLRCFLKKKIEEKWALWTRHEPCGLLTNLKHVCGLTCMQVGWLQAGAEQNISLGIRLPIVAEQQDLSLKREWYHPLKAVGTVSLCLVPWQTEQVSLAGVPARSRFDFVWFFCLPGWGLANCGHSAPTEQQMLHGQHIIFVLSLLLHWSDFLPEKKPFVLVVNTKFCLCC